MNRAEALALNTALNQKELKVKNLTGAQYVSLIGLKRPLVKYLNEIGEEEQELFKSHDVVTDADLMSKATDKTFQDKLKLIQSPEFTPKEVNFIALDEFKKFTDEVDFASGSVLAEYLLVKS